MPPELTLDPTQLDLSDPSTMEAIMLTTQQTGSLVLFLPYYTLRYAVSAGLNGKARAILAGDGPPTGVFTGHITGKAPQARVDDNGKVVTSD